MTVKAFTCEYPTLSRELAMAIQVAFPIIPGIPHEESVKAKALWDTGAMASVITPKIANQLGLIPTGRAVVHTANGEAEQNTYFVSLILPSSIAVNAIVTEAGLSPGIDCLIGMDIIQLGDFSLSNFQGQTVFSFRVPSMEKADFQRAAQSAATTRAERRTQQGKKKRK